jgi:hypothetical protein
MALAVTLRGSGCALAPQGDEQGLRKPQSVTLRCEPRLRRASKDVGRVRGRA